MGEVKFTRMDTDASVVISYDPFSIPADEKMKPLMVKGIQGISTDEEKKAFQMLWQQRVENILLAPELWDKLITIHK